MIKYESENNVKHRSNGILVWTKTICRFGSVDLAKIRRLSNKIGSFKFKIIFFYLIESTEIVNIRPF